ncbi:MAG: FitA-like ribbon-helix-helix domain-containing protein [Angustibacter sp.]
MAAISVRDLDDRVRDGLRERAARRGRSMEAEIRAILTAAVDQPDGPRPSLRDTMLDLARRPGGGHLDLPPRRTPPRAPDLTR